MSIPLETKLLPPPTEFGKNLWQLAQQITNSTDTQVIFQTYRLLLERLLFIHAESTDRLANSDPNSYNT